MTRREQHRGELDQLLLGKPVLRVMRHHQGAEQVVGRLTPALRHQRAEVVRELTEPRVALFGGQRRRGHERVRPSSELLPVRVRHAEQLTDHRRRERQCEVRHQVGGRPGRDHRVEHTAGDRLGPGPQPFDPARGERLRDDPPYAGVLGGSRSTMPPGTFCSWVRGTSRTTVSARLNRGSLSTVRTSSYRLTSHASSPYGRLTRHTGSVSRISSSRGSNVRPCGSPNGNRLTTVTTPSLFPRRDDHGGMGASTRDRPRRVRCHGSTAPASCRVRIPQLFSPYALLRPSLRPSTATSLTSAATLFRPWSTWVAAIAAQVSAASSPP